MIDLHCHILPGIDDGAKDLSVSLAMAEAFVNDGVEVVACTPHILPGLYHNRGGDIRKAVADLQSHIDRAGLPLRLTTGADVHVAPNLAAGLRSGEILSLADSRYVLIEPPHHVLPVRFEETLFDLMLSGYVPIVTHPERLSWIKENYVILQRLVGNGVWMQITAGSLTGKFGKAPLYWSERMLNEGLVHVIASDAHDVSRRRPDLAEGAARAAHVLGAAEAQQLVIGRPQGVLQNLAPEALARPDGRGTKEFAASAGNRRGVMRSGDGHGNAGNGVGVSGGVGRFGQRLRQLFR